MTPVPDKLTELLEAAFREVADASWAELLLPFARELYRQAYAFRLHQRTAADNRIEHELVVLRNTLRIAWHSGAERASGLPFSLHEWRVAIAVSLLHDLRFIPRITEEMVVGAVDSDSAERIAQARARQRQEHMRGSVEDAQRLLQDLPGLMSDVETRECLGYIGLHDLWKLGWPYPPSSDWLAVCCLEGDALWPLDSEFGPLADLERKGQDSPDFATLRRQAADNFRLQLCAYRDTFPSTEPFRDGETMIRTSEGAKILAELRRFWDI
ncbi:MAG: hypothetical protein KDB14_20625 [Planctomycetales bacterium]|nr:hypothetical protein [Planctomycetales bacterium]